MLKRLFLAFISIIWEGLLLYYCIYFIKIITFLNSVLIYLLWIFLLITTLVNKNLLIIRKNWYKFFITIIRAKLPKTTVLLLVLSFFDLNVSNLFIVTLKKSCLSYQKLRLNNFAKKFFLFVVIFEYNYLHWAF